MPKARREKPIYQRGPYALHAREGRNLEIIWYDTERKRERSVSAGTADVAQGRLALDRKYLNDGGHGLCPTCHRPIEDEAPYLSRAILDYLLLKEGTAGYKATSTRLTQAVSYIAETGPSVRCAHIDAAWIGKYRDWLAKRSYAIGHVEGCVRQLAAAINATPGQKAQFKAEQPKLVSNSPTYRATVEKLAEMFNFCLRPDGKTEKVRAQQLKERANLLRYLRFAVATWARPDAIFDATDKQWLRDARVLDLNPPGRRQTKKHRPKVVVARQFVPFLDSGDAFVPVVAINQPWAKMAKKIGLPSGGEAGPKLVRRSMATLARPRMGEEKWRQGEMMLGHVKFSVSDIYALPDPANLGAALAATESIIDDIEKLAPGAFYRAVTALKIVEGGKNG